MPPDETGDRVTAAVRAFAPPTERPPGAHRRRRLREEGDAVEHRWPPVAVVFDTETTTDPTQRLLFGWYRVVSWAPAANGWRLAVDEEGVFYDDDLPHWDPAGWAVLRRFVPPTDRTIPAPADPTLYRYTRRAFLDEVLWPVIGEAKGLLVGYNLPFDLARLAGRAGPTRPRIRTKNGRRVRPSYVDAWSLRLWQRPDGSEDRFRPRVHIKHLDRNRSLMRFGPVHPDALVNPGEGAFLDLKTLVFALTDEGMSLARAGEVFDPPVKKIPLEEAFGRITAKSLAYGRRDVAATASLLEVVRREFDRHPLDVRPHDVRSPATIAKAYLRAFGVTPPLRRRRHVRRRRLAQATAAYFGGRAECRIRKTIVPVVSTDVTSMYPTVNILAKLRELVVAERLVARDGTAVARATLGQLTPEALLRPDTWPALRFFAELQPDGDVLPLRTHYDPRNRVPTIGVNPVHSTVPLWYTGFDLAASYLLTQKVPRIRQAFRIDGTGVLPGLSPVLFRGETRIDPDADDVFRAVIEARHRVKADASRPAAEREALQRGLKVFANSGSYGVLAEFNPRRLPGEATETVRVEYGSAPAFDAQVRSPEIPGEFCFPPLAAFITGAARLLLTVIERLVTDRGGTYLAMDTDSIHIVATEDGGLVPCPGGPLRDQQGTPAIRALSWAEVDVIVAAVDQLKPYGPAVQDSLLKIESENSARKSTTRRQLYGLALAAKRYVLFNDPPDGDVDLRKRSDHGLGVYLDPTDPTPRTEAPPEPDPNEGWMATVWKDFIRRTAGRARGRAPAWYDRPAVVQFTASSPDRLKPYTARKGHPPYGERLKPFNFMLAVNVEPDSVTAPLRRDRYRLIAPFERDPRRWWDAEWRDLYSGTRCRVATSGAGAPGVVVAMPIRRVIEDYWRHPEWKSTRPMRAPHEPDPIGLLPRRPVQVLGTRPIGKEAAFVEEAEEGLGSADDLVVDYRAEPNERATWREIVAALKTLSTAEVASLARKLGINPRGLWRYRTGKGARPGRRRSLEGWFDQRSRNQVPESDGASRSHG
ncbi:MAG: hypothetical protein SFV24_16840 [Gemmatimonadales bacterium]|nr:hypothetical protein [Gemmatimonadales bacterium]